MNQAFCPNCEYDVSPDASFCTNCRETIATHKYCLECGAQNEATARFCGRCRNTQFVSSRAAGFVEPTAAGFGPYQPRPGRVRAAELDLNVVISLPRVIILSVISSGFYSIWWMYRTWAQLQSESENRHFPVWHSLTQSVPVYGLFRLFAHMSLIHQLRSRLDTPSSLNPGVIVTISAVAWLMIIVSWNAAGGAALFFMALQALMSTAIVAWPQVALNEYWIGSRGDTVEEAKIAPGEVIFTIIGALV